MKNFKKALSLLLSVMMVFSVMTVSSFAATVDEDGDGKATIDGVEYVVIDTKAELLAATAANTNYILDRDIWLGEDDGTTETTYSAVALTLGDGSVLNGNGYTISGFNLDSTLEGVIAFAGTACVKNLKIGTSASPVATTEGIFVSGANTNVSFEYVDVFVALTNADDDAGAFCSSGAGELNFTNCAVYGSIENNWKTGGFIGSYTGSSLIMTNCVNKATVKGFSCVGGLIGQINFASGGSVEIDGCTNVGDVTSAAPAGGGFIGSFTWTGKTSSLVISNSKNNGRITSNTSAAGNRQGIGGFVGFVDENASKIEFNGCVNNGEIVSTQADKPASGGIVGYTTKAITLASCVNYGVISGVKKAGGLIGYNTGTVNITDSANFGNISSNENCGGIVGEVGAAITFTGVINFGDVTCPWNLGGFTGFTGKEVTLTDCTNLGTINGTGGSNSGRASQAIAGGDKTTVMNNFYAFGKMTGTVTNDYTGTFEGHSGTFSGSGNKCLNNQTTYKNQNGVDENSSITVTEAKELLEARYADLDFACSETAVYLATPMLRATQCTVPAGDTQKVRFIATTNVADYAIIESIGFNVVINSANDKGDVKCSYLYNSISATENGNTVSYSSSAMGGDNMFVLSIKDVPTTGTVTFTVKPFVNTSEGTHYGTAYNVVYTNGVCTSFTAVQNNA